MLRAPVGQRGPEMDGSRDGGEEQKYTGREEWTLVLSLFKAISGLAAKRKTPVFIQDTSQTSS